MTHAADTCSELDKADLARQRRRSLSKKVGSQTVRYAFSESEWLSELGGIALPEVGGMRVR